MNEKSLKLLEQYDIEVTGTRRGRGSYLCETSLGTKLFADYVGSEHKIALVNQILEHMEDQGYAFADKVLPTREGALMTSDRDGNTYVLKDWYEGRECDTRNTSEIVQASANLARLHRMMRVPVQGKMLPCQRETLNEETQVCSEEAPREVFSACPGEPLQELWRRHNRELGKIRSYVRRRKHRTEFEQQFLQNFPVFYEQAQDALEILEHSSCEVLYRESLANGCICHGSYTQHNVYFLSRRKIFTANFDHCRCDVQTADLYQFLRKILEKQDWSPQTGHRMLEAYSAEKPLRRGELEYLRIRLCYPEKFWKLANQYYNCGKSCISQKHAPKLERLLAQEKQRLRFLKTLE